MGMFLRSDAAITNPLPNTPAYADTLTGLLYDYNPDTLATADTAGVTAWASSRGAGGGGTLNKGTNGPTILYSAGLNGHKAVVFNGTSAWMETGALNPVPKSPLTLVTVFRYASTGAVQRVYGAGTASDFYSLRVETTGRIRLETTTGGTGLGIDGPILTAGTYYAVVAVIDGANSSITVNGSTTKGTLGAVTTGSPFRLGTNTTKTTHWFFGRIGRHLTYGRALNATDISGVTAIMRETYAL